MLIPSSLPIYSRYVISPDTCRTICSCHLLHCPLTGGTLSRPVPAEQHAHAIFFAHLQLVCDLARYLQNNMLMSPSPLPTYRWYVISADTCRTGCSCRLLLMLTPSLPSPTYRLYVISCTICGTGCSRRLLLHLLAACP